ncbi:MAG: alpha/beta hydrolase [Thaumarchaeota archaeon]|nr:alpha/beta hydrolase [Nitrososphaerota archaeon]
MKIGSISLYYEESGEGNEHIVLVHPAPLDHTAWLFQVPYFSQRYHVISIDQRCFGLSDKPTNSFDISEFGKDLEGIIEALAIERCHVVGVSLGGIASQMLAISQPRRVRSLVLADTLAFTAKSDTLKERLRNFKEQGIEGYYEAAVRTLFSGSFQRTDLGNYLIRMFVEKSASLSLDSLITCYEALLKLDLRPKLHAITAPTLVIAGTADYAFQDSKQISELIPGARFIAFNDCGHLTQLESPLLFNSAVEALLKES